MERAIEHAVNQLPWIGLGLVMAGVAVGLAVAAAVKWRKK